MIVRLKEGIRVVLERRVSGFNSTIVRLKVGTFVVFTETADKFQFYDSTIKSMYS